jgi:hypothetical protein
MMYNPFVLPNEDSGPRLIDDCPKLVIPDQIPEPGHRPVAGSGRLSEEADLISDPLLA